MKREREDDADEGEIRAPPRNGMAMYEILSIPSHTKGLNQSSVSSDFFLPSALSKQVCFHLNFHPRKTIILTLPCNCFLCATSFFIICRVAAMTEQ